MGGIFETPLGTKHQKIQIYTIQDYFEGRRPDLPQLSNMLQASGLGAKRTVGRQTTLVDDVEGDHTLIHTDMLADALLGR